MRVDRWVRLHYPTLRRRHIDEALKQHLVKSAGGHALTKGAPLPPHQEPDCAELDRHLDRLRAGNPALQIPVLWESDVLVAIDKPPGLPSHPLSLFDTDTVTGWALARYPEILRWATECQPTVAPHRLDTDTSGVLLVARTAEAYQLWRRRFGHKQIAKRYLAWCWGRGPSGSRVIDSGIAHDPRDARKMIAVAGKRERFRGRVLDASTKTAMCRQLPDRFLCELTLHTGVTHQIRVHMAALGNPLLGDRLYDPQFDSRSDHPARVLLRSVEVTCGTFTVTAPEEEFARLY